MAAKLRRVVVVGNGIAGLTASDSLRSAGFEGDLTIVGAETGAAYSRPALSKTLLRIDGDDGAHQLPAPDHGALELLGRSATGLDRDGRLLRLDDGTQLPYDGLVVASGSRARRLGHGADEHVLRTLDDARALRERIARRPDVLVVGGGPLGMEAASGALDAGCRVTLVATETPLVRHLGSFLSETIRRAALERGLRLVISPAVRVIERDGRSAVLLADGQMLEADLLLTAVGDIPNTEWLTGAGLPPRSCTPGGALRVDSRGRVSPEIVAAGDVAAAPGPLGHARSPLWMSAIDQARVAALALLQGDDAPELNSQPYFWTEQFGLHLRVAGSTPLVGEPELVDGDTAAGPSLLRWQHDDGTATAVSVNYRIAIPRLRRLCASAG